MKIRENTLLKVAITIALACVVALLVSGRANAYPGFDPHIPDPFGGFCPGGGWGGTFGGLGYCDGRPYPDGTMWHATFSGWTRAMFCVVNTGAPLPPPAPPGGCGGAW